MAPEQATEKLVAQLRQKQVLSVVGLMSGTSMDGIDAVLMHTDGLEQVETVSRAEFAYDAAFRREISDAVDLAANFGDEESCRKRLRDLELQITARHEEAVARLLNIEGLSTEHVDLAGFHGQTVLHRPNEGFTVQLGDGQMLANRTGIPVAYDLRGNDMAHGGQGAPLVPVYHQTLAKLVGVRGPAGFKGARPVAFVNIGGISNITYVGRDGILLAFDTGPGNALIDQWVQSEGGIPFDQDGMIAAEGGVIFTMAERYLADPFFDRAVPKSLDRKDFAPPPAGSANLEDGARTLAHVSAASIIKACDHLPEPPALWIISGGGRKNPAIMQDLRELAKRRNKSRVIASEEAGLDGDSMEAEAWAYLAVRSLKGLPITFPGTTGCSHPVSGGRLAMPKAG